MAKLIGMGGSVFVDAAEYPVSTWSVNVSNDVQDVTDTGSGGWVARLAGVDSAEFTFSAFWGSSVLLLSSVFAIGTVVDAEFVIGNTETFFAVSGIVSSFTVTNTAKTPVEFQCTIQSNGTVTMPVAGSI